MRFLIYDLDSEQEREYLLEMFLGKLGGFRNRNSYEVRLQCKNMFNEGQFENSEISVHTKTEVRLVSIIILICGYG